MNNISKGCMAIVVGLDYPFLILAHVNDQCTNGLWECTLKSELHNYVDAYIPEELLSRITDADELVVELYQRGLDR